LQKISGEKASDYKECGHPKNVQELVCKNNQQEFAKTLRLLVQVNKDRGVKKNPKKKQGGPCVVKGCQSLHLARVTCCMQFKAKTPPEGGVLLVETRGVYFPPQIKQLRPCLF